jgi:hypothetical protein
MSKTKIKATCYRRASRVEAASERHESAAQLKRAERTTEQLKGMTLDDRDQAILAARVAAFDPTEGPREGDYVDFADGVTRQISYVCPDGVQTSDNGRFYLGKGYLSFSGGHYGAVPTETLTLIEGVTREAWAWFFHHDHRVAHNDIDVRVLMRVWISSAKAPK